MNIKHHLSSLPAWILSVITLIAILWLTLAPKPMGEVEVPLFPGSDKIAHGVMFGFLTFTGLLDLTRGHGYRSIVWWEALVMACVSSAVGVVIEYLQRGMALGRSFDEMDMVADAVGSFAVAAIWMIAEGRRRAGSKP